jgi:hypothetical protein
MRDNKIRNRYFAISADRNVIKKEAEKILKYKDLIIEIQSMWNMKGRMIPVIIGTNRTFTKYSDNNRATYRESTKLRNHKKKPYLALHTNCGKC